MVNYQKGKCSCKPTHQRDIEYQSHEAWVELAISALCNNPGSKFKHIAKAHGISPLILQN